MLTTAASHCDARRNPKDIEGSKKAQLQLLPISAERHAAAALADGADKYGQFNWRAEKIEPGQYVAACRRHLAAWYEGEECAPDSGVHHLGHAIATLMILLDAQEHGCLNDDRPLLASPSQVATQTSRSPSR